MGYCIRGLLDLGLSSSSCLSTMDVASGERKLFQGSYAPSEPLLRCLANHMGQERYASWRERSVWSAGRLPDKAPQVTSRSSLIISSPQPFWHERLAQENPDWLRLAWQSEVSEGLRSTDVRYCSSLSEASILTASLHLAVKDVEDPEHILKTECSSTVSLVIAHDLLRLLLDEESVEGGVSGARHRFKEGLGEKHYWALLASFRNAAEELGRSSSHPIDFLVYEPLLGTEQPILKAMGEEDVSLKLSEGLEWMFGEL